MSVFSVLKAANRAPLEALATAVEDYDATAAASDLFGAYDDFLAILNDESQRSHLDGLDQEPALTDELFEKSRAVGNRFQNGLTTLFFNSNDALTTAVQRYGVF